MKSKSIKGNSPEEIQHALQESMTDGFRPTLAIVFLSIKQDRDAICNLLEKQDIAIYGATTSGEFIDDELLQGSIAVLLLDINPDYFFIQFAELNGTDDRKLALEIGNIALGKFDTPAFLIAGSNLQTDAEQLLFGFEDVLGKNANIFGGMAGDDFSFTEQFVFTNGRSSSRGIVAIALDEDKITIKGRATCGWKAVGTEKTVTKSEGNRVYTIDNVPALDITAKYSGLGDIKKENKDLILELSTSFPLQLQRENGDPVMRPGLVINWDDHSFICSGSVPQGSKVKFSLPPDFDVIEKVIHALEDLRDTEMPEADAVIVYSCAGRFLSLGPMMNNEIEGVREVWNVPMAGFFSNAELARATNGNLEMHTITTCCVALKEK